MKYLRDGWLLSLFICLPVFAQDPESDNLANDEKKDLNQIVSKLRELSATRPAPQPIKIKQLQKNKLALVDQILSHEDLEEPQRILARIAQLQSYAILFNFEFREKNLTEEFIQEYSAILEETIADDSARISAEATTASASFHTGQYVLEPNDENAISCAKHMDAMNRLGPKEPLLQATRRLLLEQLWNCDRPKLVFEKISETDEKVAKIVLDQVDNVTNKETADFRWSKHFAKFGDFASQRRLAGMYETGTGTRQNNSQAVRWYTKLAQSGDLSSQIKLGDFFLSGKGFAKDEKKAVEYYRQAATTGSRVAQFKLGQCYRTGAGVNQSDDTWKRWVKAAAENANQIDAQNIYLSIDYEADPDSFRIFYESLVEQFPDDVYFLNNLSYSLLIGSEKDPERALELVNKALEKAPEDFTGVDSFIDTKAHALKQLGKLEEAAKLFESIVEQAQDPKPVFEALIECYQEIAPEKSEEYKKRLAESNSAEESNKNNP